MYQLQIDPDDKPFPCRTLAEISFWLRYHGISHDETLTKRKRDIPRLAEQLKGQGVRLA